MAILATGKTWANADQVTAALLNQSVNSATFATGIGEATDGTTTEVSSGSIIVKDSGITPAKLSTGGPEWTSGGVVSLGDLSFTNANPEILGGDTNGVMYVAPSTTKDLGGNILLYGDTHASKAKDIEIRATTGVEAHYDDSASKWDFQANAISTSGVLTAVGTSLTGTAAGLTVGATTGVEDGADVTDTANVTAAGALMDSELTSIGSVKALNQGVTTTGTPTFAKVTATTGVLFGTDTAAVNTLDDYEEGTWTPVLKIGGATTGINYGAAVGSYTKIGNLVNASLYVLLSSKGSATGSVTISVPFAAANTTNGFASAHVGSILACTWADYPAGYLSKNSSDISFKQYTESGGSSGISNSNLTDTSSFIMSITYRV
jgi:hypothetical protein